MVPALAVACGGTTVSADRSASYQRFRRAAIESATAQFVDWAVSHGHEEPAKAFARAFEVTMGDIHGRPNTTVTFDDREVEGSTALAQGCSLSPILEALMLRFDNPPDGVIRKGAHDDLQITLCGSRAIPSADLLPDTSAVGGEYNAAKSVAVGRQAVAAVANGLAASVATHCTVWGRPVGDISKWLADVWIPKTTARIDRIRQVASISVDAAIMIAHRIRGPGRLGAHWLNGVPASAITDDIITKLRNIDDLWLHMLVELAGHQWESLERPEKELVTAVTFSDTAGALGHASLAIDAKSYATNGTAQATPHILKWASDSKVDPSPWARVLFPGRVPRTNDVAAWEAAAAEAAQFAAVARADDLRALAQRARDNVSNGADHNIVDARANLYVRALDAVPDDLPRLDARGRAGRSSLRFALNRLYDLPA
jgi:hypothetical protein